MRLHRLFGLFLILLGAACLVAAVVALFTPWGDSYLAIRLGIPGAMLAPVVGVACLIFGIAYWMAPDAHRHMGRAISAMNQHVRKRMLSSGRP
jgi:hypothetical protein